MINQQCIKLCWYRSHIMSLFTAVAFSKKEHLRQETSQSGCEYALFCYHWITLLFLDQYHSIWSSDTYLILNSKANSQLSTQKANPYRLSSLASTYPFTIHPFLYSIVSNSPYGKESPRKPCRYLPSPTPPAGEEALRPRTRYTHHVQTSPAGPPSPQYDAPIRVHASTKVSRLTCRIHQPHSSDR